MAEPCIFCSHVYSKETMKQSLSKPDRYICERCSNILKEEKPQSFPTRLRALEKNIIKVCYELSKQGYATAKWADMARAFNRIADELEKEE